MMMELEIGDPWKRKRRLFPEVFDDLMPRFSAERQLPVIREPLIELANRGNAFELKAELPGVEKKNINLDVSENSISIGAETKKILKEENKQKGIFYSERSMASFFRTIQLPEPIMPNKAKAEYVDGILSINLPKLHPLEGKKNSIKLEVK
jgi:HSP20 family protein